MSETTERINTVTGTSQPHDSAVKQVVGEAVYICDMAEPAGTLHVQVGYASVAHAQISSIDLSEVESYPGVVTVLTATDIPGMNDVAPVIAGDPVFAESEVEYAGQSIFAVAATTLDAARKAAHLAKIEYEPLPVISDVASAMRQQSYVLDSKELSRGDVETGLAQSTHRLRGELSIGGQDHFYLESQAAMAEPGEDDDVLIYSSTQHPSEVQHCCARVLGAADHCALTFIETH